MQKFTDHIRVNYQSLNKKFCYKILKCRKLHLKLQLSIKKFLCV